MHDNDLMIWDNLKVVLAISRSGSLTSAAHLLDIDQSTAGRRLSSYEAELGVILFIRSKSGFIPTEAGAIAIQHAQKVERMMDRLQDDLAETQHGAVGIVRLMGNSWVLQRLAGKSVSTFLQQNPQLELRMASHLPPTRIHGDASVSLWFEASPHTTEFTLPLGLVPYRVYRAKTAPTKTNNWVIFQDDEQSRPIISKRNRKLVGSTGKIVFTATDAGIMLEAVAQGVGKALLPSCLAENHPDLIQDNLKQAPFERLLYMHLSHDTFETKRVQTTVDWLRSIFAGTFNAKHQPKIS